MSQKRPHTADYTDHAYWGGLIKMSLSRFFILCVLHQRPMHGYEIARNVERCTRSCCTPTEGTLYPALREFQAGGYLWVREETVGGRRRRVYALTDKGREAYRVAAQAWLEVAERIRDADRIAVGAAAG